ncbi:ComF family protein [Cupriavidus sp. D39]|uniref:ComF family protein n=1 Tax=Cupriavidus sp. D39 TaxID=2997877 RepID=UPI0022718A07|nr:hypothetical protein [Cupriavidus sp. D39]MCY0857588.1 hypothetical protein [Cupriavidus sp. D39]
MLGDYARPQDGLVLALKFGGVLPLADWLAGELARRWQAESGTSGVALPDVLAPIPLSAQRLAERGFNQSWEIARPLARRLGVRAAPTLRAIPRPKPRWTCPRARPTCRMPLASCPATTWRASMSAWSTM